MKFYLDTANLEEIRRINRLGLVDGVTTNPSLIATEIEKGRGVDFRSQIRAICAEVSGPVSAEVIGLTVEEMLAEARDIATWADNVVVKVPMTEAGLEAVYQLSQEGIKTNVTLIFSVAQGLMAAKAGATYISPFIGRIDDIGEDGLELVANLKEVMTRFHYKTEIIAASIRTIIHLEESALAGADIATIPGSLLPKLWSHPLTDIGIARFLEDWQNAGQ